MPGQCRLVRVGQPCVHQPACSRALSAYRSLVRAVDGSAAHRLFDAFVVGDWRSDVHLFKMRRRLNLVQRITVNS